MMKLKPNTVYFIWFAYRNHPTKPFGIPVEEEPLRLQPNKPEEKKGILWVNIGFFSTNADGLVPFFRRSGEIFPLPNKDKVYKK